MKTYLIALSMLAVFATLTDAHAQNNYCTAECHYDGGDPRIGLGHEDGGGGAVLRVNNHYAGFALFPRATVDQCLDTVSRLAAGHNCQKRITVNTYLNADGSYSGTYFAIGRGVEPGSK